MHVKSQSHRTDGMATPHLAYSDRIGGGNTRIGYTVVGRESGSGDGQERRSGSDSACPCKLPEPAPCPDPEMNSTKRQRR